MTVESKNVVVVTEGAQPPPVIKPIDEQQSGVMTYASYQKRIAWVAGIVTAGLIPATYWFLEPRWLEFFAREDTWQYLVLPIASGFIGGGQAIYQWYSARQIRKERINNGLPCSPIKGKQ